MKTRKKSLLVIPAILLLFFSGCQKDFGTYYMEYVGFWDSEKYVIEIWSDGGAYLMKRNRYEYYGWVDINRNRIKFTSDDGEFTKRLTINQPPSVDEFGVMFMELDRKRFTLY